ncbi:MAG: heavy metal-binding domain-containing protein [Mariniphaga sp.]
MRKFMSILLLGFMATSISALGFTRISICQSSLQKVDTALKVSYTCPMHPEVIQDKPGKCAKCKMNLVKKEMTSTVYTCPMHPEVVQDKPGKCTKCKMNLVKKEQPKKMESQKK